jgi:hypothetical protein
MHTARPMAKMLISLIRLFAAQFASYRKRFTGRGLASLDADRGKNLDSDPERKHRPRGAEAVLEGRDPDTITYDPRTWREADGTMPFGLPDTDEPTAVLAPKAIAAAAHVPVRVVYDAIAADEMPGVGELPPRRGRGLARKRIDARAYARWTIIHGLTWLSGKR